MRPSSDQCPSLVARLRLARLRGRGHRLEVGLHVRVKLIMQLLQVVVVVFAFEQLVAEQDLGQAGVLARNQFVTGIAQRAEVGGAQVVASLGREGGGPRRPRRP